MASNELKKISGKCMSKFLLLCFSGHVALVCGLLGGVASRQVTIKEGRYIHRSLVYACVILESVFALTSLGLACLYFLANWNPWEYLITKLMQTFVASSAFAALMLTVFTCVFPPTLPFMVPAIIFTTVVSILILVLPAFFGGYFETLGHRLSTYIRGVDAGSEVNAAVNSSIEISNLITKNPASQADPQVHLMDQYNELAVLGFVISEIRDALTKEEKYIYFGGYLAVLTALQEWRSLKSQRKGGITSNSLTNDDFLKKREARVTEVFNEMVGLIDEHLNRTSIAPVTSALCYKMKGDYFRYLAETQEGVARAKISKESLKAYEDATKFSMSTCSNGGAFTLGLNLSKAILHYEILDLPERARAIAEGAYQAGVQGVENSKALIETLKNTITLWADPVINQETINLETNGVVSLGQKYVKEIKRQIDCVLKRKMMLEPSVVRRSPYRSRIVEIEKPLQPVELHVTECIFMGLGFEYDILFKHISGLEVGRVILESLIPKSHVHVGVITVWAILLNHEERFKSPGSRGRLFCHSLLITSDMVDKTMTEDAKYMAFQASMDNILRHNKLSKVEAELVFFPIIRAQHFYLLCFDLTKDEYFLIDNIAYGDESYERYEKVPELLRQLFIRYLCAVSHPTSERVKFSNVNRLRMSWRTKQNGVDCGVFLMRHMETFKGGGLAGFNSGFKMEGEEQDSQLFDLRHKYLSKMLLSDINEVGWKVNLEAEVYMKLPNGQKVLLRNDAQVRVEERLRKCG